MGQGGFSKEKLEVLCNFVDVEKCRRDSYVKEDYYCFVGRLSHEKGVSTLIDAAASLPYKLKVIGDGPLVEELQAKSRRLRANIEFVGFKEWEEIKELVGKARFIVVPSEWYENNPLSVIEALCLGTPVLGARIGGIPELIEEGVAGMTFDSGNADDLTNKIGRMFSTSFNYAAIAEKASSSFGADGYYHKLMDLYKKQIKQNY